MNINQLQYVKTVAKYLSFSKASQVLFVSQSAISQSISKLESELNIKIFERSTKDVKLTEEGQKAINIIEGLLQDVDKLHDIQATIRTGNEINLAIVKGLFLPFILQLLGNEVGDTKIRFIEEDSIEIVKKVKKQLIDIGIVPIYEENIELVKTLDIMPITPIHNYVFMSKKNKLASHRGITLQDLEKEDITLYDGSFLKWTFQQLKNANPKLKLLFTSSNQEIIREFTSNNQGITIDTIAESIVNPYIHTGEVVAIPLINHLPQDNYLGMVSSYTNQNKSSFLKIHHLIHSYVNKEVNKIHHEVKY